MPFTANRQFKANPRMLATAKGMHYWTPDGRQILDGTSRACGASTPATAARRSRRRSAQQLDDHGLRAVVPDGPSRARSSWRTRRAASCRRATRPRLLHATPARRRSTRALKIALAYHRARGEGTRTRFIGRERGYHGVGFGGISVGGMVNNRKWFGAMLPGVDHLPHTHDLAAATPSRGASRSTARISPMRWKRIVALHDASNIAAVIVEPVRRLDRRAVAAQGLSGAPARDLRQARHPADLRRGHHRLRPPRRAVRRRASSA